ncbi:type II secretion system protein GspD [Pseudoalteromonas tunicata]|nr:secretin N-terminal domain-containing protein [Pseudoalteromonas tunicata]ATC93397.1 general secretion pathway protein D [Pseudoalteromonas tunicata]AXT32757.1 general secretion pathway protein GspD [Pseudoalteromonas tunicata]
MNKINAISITIVGLFVLNGCSATQNKSFSPQPSYLHSNISVVADGDEAAVNEKNEASQNNEPDKKVEYLTPFQVIQQQAQITNDVIDRFSEQKTIEMSAETLPLQDFLHLVLGERLKVSYVLSDEIKADSQSVTLNIQNAVTERKLFLLTEELIDERGYTIRFNDNIFYVHKKNSEQGQTDLTYGYGKSINDVPQTSGDIVQMVPFEYGMQLSMSNTLRQMIGVKSTSDPARNTINIFGKRQDILRALELIDIFDRPAIANRHIGVYKSTFVNGTELLTKLKELLTQEGIKLGDGIDTSSTITVVNMEKQNRLIFFAVKQDVIERAIFWANQIDKPIDTAEKQYFIYQPQYSRAVDMGESLEALIGEVSSLTTSTSAAQENSRKRGAVTASSEDLKMVIDERSNSVIFFTTGEKYQQILPLVKRLDILPKQIMLEVIIAEVSLTNEFKQGVEFAFKNGNYGTSTEKAFMGDGFGGLSYLLQGTQGKLIVNLLQTNSLVNILSRPSLVVRDGVNATINVGTDIPIVGETASDPINGDRQTTKIEYRKTGVELAVTPTVNAQGIVLMEIKQKISNQVESGSTVSGNPSVFERTINTEVVAESGQTIILGGLISENKSTKASRVPFFSGIPILGNLFRADTESGDKTELVILVTPRVIESSSEWDDVKKLFDNAFENLKLPQK